jgi:perosamine synthetase
MKPVFASLGSNYSRAFVFEALGQLIRPNYKAVSELQRRLARDFSGEVELFYKGRDAIQYSLIRLGLTDGSQVLTQAFSCFAIEEAIVGAGAEPVYVDVGQGTTNLTVATLKEALQHAPRARAILVQHSLGVPAEIEAIRRWCDQHQLVLIEDLAQGFGGLDDNGFLLGQYADVVICSFGRDKVIDAVSGGACIFRKTKITQQLLSASPNQPINLLTLARKHQIRDLVYPFLTWMIRRTHTLGVGKLIFRLSRWLGWLSSPIENPALPLTRMPAAYAHLALWQWRGLSRQLEHRRQLATIYHQSLQRAIEDGLTGVQLIMSQEQIARSSNLRYPLLVRQPDSVTARLTRQSIFCTDRWYRQAVDCGKLECHSTYTIGSCPQAEALASQMLNLPTHQQVSRDQAKEIAVKLIDILKDSH